jgi:O-antigen/teichoic acid export membrane protein
LEVVLIVSVGKIFTMSMGCINNIITNSKYYSYVFWFSTASAVLAVILNLYFIQWYGIIGAAYATLMVIVMINFLKILLVQVRFKINPYSKQTFYTLGIILLLYFCISWIPFDFTPFFSLVLRSLFIGTVFAILAYFLKLTGDIQAFLSKLLPSVKKA